MERSSDTDMKKKKSLLKEIIKHRNNYLFMAPFLIIFLLFTVVPVIVSIIFSFTYFNVLEPPRFIGLQNYYKLFLNDSLFITAFSNTLVLAVITGPVGYVLSLFLAWVLNEFSPIVRTVLTFFFYTPSLCGSIFVIWQIIFNGDQYGLLNGVLMNLDLIYEPIDWTRNTQYMLPVAVLIIVWSSFGTGFLSFIAGYQGVDKKLYEAGAMDGISNRWQELWYITLPSMKPQLMFGAVMQITNSLSISSISIDLVGFPSIEYAGHTILTHLHDYGNVRYEMGYACTIAVVLFFIMMLCNVVVQKLLRRLG